MNYQIAIPSYRRPAALLEKTLTLLERVHAPLDRATVFVANEEERASYVAAGVKTNIVVGEKGMGAIRRFIQAHYPEGERILNIDDDLEDLVLRLGEKRTVSVDRFSFSEIVAEGFETCRVIGARLWGIYPVPNPYFMKDRVVLGLRYINGTFWGSVNTHDDVLTVSLDDKEDFERSLKVFAKDRKMVRIERVAPKTRFYKEPGGMQEDRTEERITASAEFLAEKYPGLCALNLSKKSGHAEVRMRRLGKKPGG